MSATFDVFDNLSLVGKLGVIVCWWWDDEEGCAFAPAAVELLPKVIMGRTSAFDTDDWWVLLDALENFPRRDEQLNQILDVMRQGAAGETIGRDTTCFDDAFAATWDAIEGIGPELN